MIVMKMFHTMLSLLWHKQCGLYNFFPGSQNGGKEGLSGKLCQFWGKGVGAFLTFFFWGGGGWPCLSGHGGLTLNPCIDHTGHKSGFVIYIYLMSLEADPTGLTFDCMILRVSSRFWSIPTFTLKFQHFDWSLPFFYSNFKILIDLKISTQFQHFDRFPTFFVLKFQYSDPFVIFNQI